MKRFHRIIARIRNALAIIETLPASQVEIQRALAQGVVALRDDLIETQRILAQVNLGMVSLQDDLAEIRRASASLEWSIGTEANCVERLLYAIGHETLAVAGVARLVDLVESKIRKDAKIDKVGIHRRIGEAIFARSQTLYSGEELLPCLVRYTYPPVLSIALSSHCNAACFFCREADYKGDSVNYADISKLQNAIRHARQVDLTGWGEPFFYPRLQEVIEYITSLNRSPHLLSFTSNGTFLTDDLGRQLAGKLYSLTVSINAATPQTYADQMRYKNSAFTFGAVIENLRAFLGAVTPEDRRRFVLHMVANSENFHEIGALVELAGELDVPVVSVGNYICAQEQHRDKTLWNVKEAYNTELARACDIGGRLGVAVAGRSFFSNEEAIKGPDNCFAPFERFYVEMPGLAAPCCFMGRARMGNVYADGFEAVWFSDLMNKLRVKRDLPPCKVCTVFTPFDDPLAHMSAYLTTKHVEHETPTDVGNRDTAFRNNVAAKA